MKKIISLIIVSVVLLTAVFNASAADANVTYSGNAKEFVFAPGSQYSPTDLFPEFKDVMPGDSLTQKITVKNASSNGVKVKIYMRSLGAHENSADFLSKLSLKVKKSVENDMAYMFDSTADQSAQLTDWVCLGTLSSRGTVNLDVVLDVPVELDNNYKDLIGYLDWEFKIEEFPIEPSDPKPPQTGNVDIYVWSGVMAISALMIILLIIVRRKKEKDETEKTAQI